MENAGLSTEPEYWTQFDGDACFYDSIDTILDRRLSIAEGQLGETAAHPFFGEGVQA